MKEGQTVYETKKNGKICLIKIELTPKRLIEILQEEESRRYGDKVVRQIDLDSWEISPNSYTLSEGYLISIVATPKTEIEESSIKV